jgi:MIP family channel proteins
MKDLKSCFAELIGTFVLVLIGIGAIHSANQQHIDLLGTALAYGLAVAAMISATATISGGHLNPAVTCGALIGGKLNAPQALCYIVAQLIGAVFAGLLCVAIFGKGAVGVATPDLGKDITTGTAILVEAVLTFIWAGAFFGSLADPRAARLGGLAVGLAVAAGVVFGGPITGAAMNPARALGSGVASLHLTNHLVYWFGPLLGGLAAGVVFGRFLIVPDTPPKK